MTVVTAEREGTATADPRAQVVRFVLAGGIVFAVQVGLGLMLPAVLDLPMQVAIPVAYTVAVLVHFSLQRWFVFAHQAFEHGVLGQIARYLPMTTSQYGFTASCTAILPGLLDVPEGAVYAAAAFVAAAAGFVFMRLVIFRGRN